MLAIWSLVPLLFLKPAGISGSSQFMYCWSLAWRILSIIFLACAAAAAAAKSLQSCPTLCDHRDHSALGSPVPGILQARTLEWVAISFFIAWKWKVKVKSLSRVQLLATPWTAAYKAPLSMGFSRQEYWSWVPLPSPKGDQFWVFTERTDAEAETPIFWPHDMKNWLFGKGPDTGKDWSQKDKGTTELEMVR